MVVRSILTNFWIILPFLWDYISNFFLNMWSSYIISLWYADYTLLPFSLQWGRSQKLFVAMGDRSKLLIISQLPRQRSKICIFKFLVFIFAAFAVGGLLGDVFLHLLPEAYQQVKYLFYSNLGFVLGKIFTSPPPLPACFILALCTIPV